jgi:hypothetical protein
MLHRRLVSLPELSGGHRYRDPDFGCGSADLTKHELRCAVPITIRVQIGSLLTSSPTITRVAHLHQMRPARTGAAIMVLVWHSSQ